MISLEKWMMLTHLQKLVKNVGDLGKFIVAKGFKSCPKSNKSPNLGTLAKLEGDVLFCPMMTRRCLFGKIYRLRHL